MVIALNKRPCDYVVTAERGMRKQDKNACVCQSHRRWWKEQRDGEAREDCHMCRELEWGEREANGGEGKAKMDLTVPIGNKNPRCA